MHELAATESILQTVLEHAHRAEAQRVVRVRLLKGELNDYVEETLRWLFLTLAEETEAAGAEVLIESLPIRFRCQDCKTEYGVERDAFEAKCILCASTHVELIGGREFYLEAIEVE